MSKRTGICSKCQGVHTGAHGSWCTECCGEYKRNYALTHTDCSKCGEPKDGSKHPFYCETCRKAWSKQNYAKNKERRNALRVEWGRKNPERLWANKLKQLYGITAERYEAMSHAQDGKCAVCRSTPRGRLHVDHDHNTGEVRGLLCDDCNHGLGFLKDNFEIITRLGWYVLEHSLAAERCLPQAR